MGDGPAGAPVVPLPGRLDRSLRLGPFPSARQAVQFLVAAALGAACSAAGVLVLGVPVLLGGAVLTLVRPGGESVEGRARILLRYGVRRLRGGPSMNRTAVRTCSDTPTIATADGRFAAVVRTGGVPLAFLPPEELARCFEQYRDLLRSLDADVRILTTRMATFGGALRPDGGSASSPDAQARAGYREMVGLLCRRRPVRTVYVALVGSGPHDTVHAHLESSVAGLVDRLAGLGVRAERMRGPALRASAVRLGLRPGTWT